MDNELFRQFYLDMDALCRKHKIVGLVGMWFHGPTDHYGFMRVHDITDTQFSAVCKAIAEKLEGWADGIHKGATSGSINELRGGKGADN